MPEAKATRVYDTKDSGEWATGSQPTLPNVSEQTSGWIHRVCSTKYLAQDQLIIGFPRGPKVDIYYATRRTTQKDAQSDLGDAGDGGLSATWTASLGQLPPAILSWKVEESPATPEASQQIETTAPEPEWSPGRLSHRLLELDADRDWAELTELILLAEDTDFTSAQSRRLSPRLLELAIQHRDSSDPRDEAAVWSAIRTGASMLLPHAVDCLRPLLEPGNSIETSLVTVKMLGRIFEAQPPTDVDQYSGLADKVRQIAESLLNRYAITVSQSAAMAHLAIYALAAMASSETLRIVEKVRGLKTAWFARRMTRKLRTLRQAWESRTDPVSDGPRGLLDSAVQSLERD